MDHSAVIVLAAGKGVRMKSDLPKVCHPLHGKPLIGHVLDTVVQLSPAQVVVIVGHRASFVRDACQGHAVEFVTQEPQLGTAHAVMQAMPVIQKELTPVLIVSGDVPLMRASSLQKLISVHERTGAAVTVLTAELSNPFGYGRIIRGDNGDVVRIVEHKDAAPEELAVAEVNTGTYVFDRSALDHALKLIKPENAQKEFYLTDAISILRGEGRRVSASLLEDPREMTGINTPEQLVEAEELFHAMRTSRPSLRA